MRTAAARRWIVGLIGAAALLASVLVAVACGGGEGAADRDPGPAAAPVRVAPRPMAQAAREAMPTETMPVERESVPPAAAVVMGAKAVGVVVTPAPTPEPASADPITIALDPGHGGIDPGAAGFGIDEAVSNLDLARRVEALLMAEGYRVVLTRRDGSNASGMTAEQLAPLHPFAARRADLQARVDYVNSEEADLFVSIHSNSHANPDLQGVEAYYNASRPFSEDNRRLAELLVKNVSGALAKFGYAATDRGVIDDACWRMFGDRCRPLFLLGPVQEIKRSELERRGFDPARFGFGPDQQAITTRATKMPGALIEALFLSNEADAAVLQDEAGRAAIARGIARAVIEFFADERSTG